MAKSRLALVAIVGAYEGPWALVDGFKKARVEVRGLGDGEGVKIEFEDHTRAGLQFGVIALGLGSNAVVMQDWSRYRVVKTVSEGSAITPTTVEIFNG